MGRNYSSVNEGFARFHHTYKPFFTFADMTEVKKSLNIQAQTTIPSSNGFGRNSIAGIDEPVSNGLKAAKVHGQVLQDDVAMRKPMRLEALNPIGKKKKKKNYDGY